MSEKMSLMAFLRELTALKYPSEVMHVTGYVASGRWEVRVDQMLPGMLFQRTFTTQGYGSFSVYEIEAPLYTLVYYAEGADFCEAWNQAAKAL